MYGRIFESIFDSSIMEEGVHVRYLWHCILVLCNKEGVVDLTRQALARRVNMPLLQVNEALECLLSPDPASRSPLEDGRRLIPIRETDWGWKVVNFEGYRDVRNPEDRRTYMREYMRGRRQKESASKPEKLTCKPESTALAPASASASASASTETETPPAKSILAPDPSASGSAARRKLREPELFELTPEATSPDDPVEFWFPLAGDEPPKSAPHGPWRRTAAGGFEWGLRRSQVLKLAELYPGVGEGGEVGVRLEIARCQDWNVENPSRRKTYPRGQGSGVWEHLKRWLGDKHGKGGPGVNGHANGANGKYGVTDAIRLANRGAMGRHPELDAKAADIQQRILDERKRQEAARGN
jgi:hypothetical protein